MENPTTHSPKGASPKSATPKRERWTASWSDLFREVANTDICTGCSGCIVACPKNVLSLDNEWHPTLAGEAWHEGDGSRCTHGERGCTICTRACPRFRAWEPQADLRIHGRQRDPDVSEEVAGIYQSLLLLNATDSGLIEHGQDGGFVSALLIYCLDRGVIDAALVSYVDDEWNTQPGVAWTRDDVIRAAGSRYTYSANLLAYQEAVENGAEKIALVGMGCQTSAAPIMMERGVRKCGKRIVLNIGLLCSKTFVDCFLDELLGDRYGLSRHDIVGMDVKGVLQLRLREGINDDNYLEVPLKECHAYTRLGCSTCPDFAAEHADISVGGIGGFDNRSLAVVRTERGAELIAEMVAAGLLESVDATATDPVAIKLLRALSTKSRKRWPIAPAADTPAGYAAPGLLSS